MRDGKNRSFSIHDNESIRWIEKITNPNKGNPLLSWQATDRLEVTALLMGVLIRLW